MALLNRRFDSLSHFLLSWILSNRLVSTQYNDLEVWKHLSQGSDSVCCSLLSIMGKGFNITILIG